jgi:hypothetical protein
MTAHACACSLCRGAWCKAKRQRTGVHTYVAEAALQVAVVVLSSAVHLLLAARSYNGQPLHVSSDFVSQNTQQESGRASCD